MNNEYKLTEQEIDDIVISQVNDDDAWEEPINVTVADPAIVSLPPKLVARAAFLPNYTTRQQLQNGYNRLFRSALILKKQLLPT